MGVLVDLAKLSKSPLNVKRQCLQFTLSSEWIVFVAFGDMPTVSNWSETLFPVFSEALFIFSAVKAERPARWQLFFLVDWR